MIGMMSRCQNQKKKEIGINKMSQLFIGIDPGQSGALAMITQDNTVITLSDWPGDEIGAAAIVREIKMKAEWREHTLLGAIERVHSMPKQGVASTFKFGANYGIWRGILAAFEIPFYTVGVHQWQKGIIKKAQDKKPALAAASRLFPNAELYGPRGGGKDGRADALLIAHWCRRQSI